MANPTPVWGQTYPVSEAERGRLVPLDMSSVSAYPVSGRGKFAVLTYTVNPISISSLSLSMTGIDSIGTLGSVLSPVSAYILTSPISAVVMSQAANTMYVASSSYGPVATVIDIGQTFKFIEVFNNTAAVAYFMASTVDFSQLTSQGLPVLSGPGTFYSLDREVASFTVGAVSSGTDLRIFAHYRV